MKITEFFVKSLAVIAVSGAVSVAFLRDSLLSIDGKDESFANLVEAEMNEKKEDLNIPSDIIEKCQKAVIAGKNADIPFLCKSIEYHCVRREKTLVFYNSNQILEYDPIYGVCVKYLYQCPVGQKVYEAGDLFERAQREATDAFFSGVNAEISAVDICYETPRTVTFKISVCDNEGAEILISYRLDTGSCIFFDATGAAELLE